MSVDAPERRETGSSAAGAKSPSAFRTITEVASELELPQHVLRFWETKFPQIRPLKRRGGRRYYRPEDVVLLREVRRLLYVDGYTIRGVQKLLRQQGRRALARAPSPPGGTGDGTSGEGEADAVGAAQAGATANEGGGPATVPPGPGEDISEPGSPKWRRDMEMSTVLRKELLALLCELEELRALLPDTITRRSD